MQFLKSMIILTSMGIMPLAQAQIVRKPVTNATTQNISQIPSDASLDQLITIMQVEKSIEAQFLQASRSTEEVMKNIFGDQLSTPRLSKNQKQELSKVMADFGKKSIDAINTPDYRQQLLNLYKRTYKETYTQQEVNAMIAFYSSPIGQSVAAKQADFDAKFTKQVAPIAVDHQRKAMNSLMPELMQKVDKIVKSTKK